MYEYLRDFDAYISRYSRTEQKDIIVNCPRCERNLLAISFSNHKLSNICEQLTKYKSDKIPEHIKRPSYILVSRTL